MEISDHDLMTSLAGGDDLALNTLMDRWGGRVITFLHKMTGQREVATDIAQETFVKLYQARGRYKPQGNFSAYLFAIAANLARNHSRWKSRHPTVSLDATDTDGTGISAEPVDRNQTPGEAAESAEKMRAVHAGFQQLPADLREAMTLFIYEGMGYAEIASISGCSQKAVETRIYRARQILKEQLKDLWQ